MAMSSDLKHVLENVLPTERVIKLDSPIEFTFISTGTIHKIVSVYKKKMDQSLLGPSKGLVYIAPLCKVLMERV